MKYTIKSGDTLWALARKHGVTVDELMRMNPHIKDRNKIYAGRTLQLPDASPQAGQAPSSLPAPAINQEAAPTGVPSPTPLPIRPPMFPDMQPAVQNPVQQDAEMAAQGMDPGLMDPTQLPFLVNPTMLAALAKAAPAALPQAGKVAAGLTASNVMPVQGAQGVAKMLLSQSAPQTGRDVMLSGPMTWRDLLYGTPALDETGALRAMMRP